MKRLIIVCEGPTEKEFCNDVLAEFFLKRGIVVDSPLIKHSGGGIVPWSLLKSQLRNHLRENNAFVSTFIDYYGIKDDYGYPGWQEGKQVRQKENRMEFLESQMLNDMEDSERPRFIPHLQLHEFESLLFSDIDAIRKNFMPNEVNWDELESIVDEFPNPEDINNSPQKAPSKRLEGAIRGYSKVLYGNCIAMDIGLDKMLVSCPHFSKWIDRLLAI